MTREEQLRKAHMPSAIALVLSIVQSQVHNAFGIVQKWHPNYEAHEKWDEKKLTPNRFWSFVVEAIETVCSRSNLLDSDRQELYEWGRKRKWTKDFPTLEELNVGLGGRPRSMADSYYGEG